MTKVGVYAILRVSTAVFGLEGVPDGKSRYRCCWRWPVLTLAIAAVRHDRAPGTCARW